MEITEVTSIQPPGYVLPMDVYLTPSTTPKLSEGDKKALSLIIAGYSFSARSQDLMRFVTVVSSTAQAYLVKIGRYGPYFDIFTQISISIARARVLLEARNDDKACAILYSIETALKIIIEKENLTATGAEMYDGKMPLVPNTDEAYEYGI